MKANIVAVLLFTAIGYVLTTESLEKLKSIVPTPRAVLPLKFKSGVTVDPGEELTPTQVKEAPEVTLPDAMKQHYTLCMIDPDAPTPRNPLSSEWLHWLVVNIPGNNFAKGQELAAYIGAAPPKGTGRHRYVFLLYRQTFVIEVDESHISNSTIFGRAKFSCCNFAKKYDMVEKPVAGNYFLAQWDEYVAQLNKQLIGK